MPTPAPQILLFTDFGPGGPYTGQVLSVLAREAPGLPVISLMADAPAHDVRASAHLLAALSASFPVGGVCVAVVDPGVGSPDREPIALEVDGVRFVGPANGLFDVALGRSVQARGWRIEWPPAGVSRTFHGRDLFAPVAARMARGDPVPGVPLDGVTLAAMRNPEDLAEVIYADGFGNCMTGLRARGVNVGSTISVGGREIAHAPTYSAVPAGRLFWYENSLGLLEIAANRRRASEMLGIAPGDAVRLSRPAWNAGAG